MEDRALTESLDEFDRMSASGPIADWLL